MNSIVKERNNSIDIFRYICAVMVVAIHTNPFAEISGTADYIVSEIISNIAVPFFFAVSGYFYIQKLIKGEKVFLPYITRLIRTYFIWSCLYFLISFISGGYKNIIGFIASSIFEFTLLGSYYHLWFFPALIFAVCMTTLLYKLKCFRLIVPISLILFALGCLGCAYYELGMKIPLLSKLFAFADFTVIRRILFMGFPFFISGLTIRKLEEKFSPLPRKNILAVF